MPRKKENLVICPVYNEASTLPKFYQQLRQYYHQDVLFVDDGSTDGSADFLLSIRDQATTLFRHPQRAGYGAALFSGFQSALPYAYERIITIDADLQHHPRHIPSFFRYLLEWEAVLGSRYLQEVEPSQAPTERFTINRYMSRLIEYLFQVNISDPFCGYRGYRASFLQKARLQEKSYGFGLEITLEVIRTRTTFKEIPVELIYLDASRQFLDGLAPPCARLLHYLEVVARKRREITSARSFCHGR